MHYISLPYLPVSHNFNCTLITSLRFILQISNAPDLPHSTPIGSTATYITLSETKGLGIRVLSSQRKVVSPLQHFPFISSLHVSALIHHHLGCLCQTRHLLRHWRYFAPNSLNSQSSSLLSTYLYKINQVVFYCSVLSLTASPSIFTTTASLKGRRSSAATGLCQLLNPHKPHPQIRDQTVSNSASCSVAFLSTKSAVILLRLSW